MAQLTHRTSGQLVADDSQLSNWEQLINKCHIAVWRRSIPNSYLYEYKGNRKLRLTYLRNLSAKL